MTVIGLFIVLVFGGGVPPMDGEIRCFWHMFTILEILRRGNPADLPRLKWDIAQHHLMYIMVFPLCLKPKLHYIFHVPECWEAWQHLLSCYGADDFCFVPFFPVPQRKGHRGVCRIFRFAMRKPSSTSIYHAVRQLFEAVGRYTTYEPVFLMDPVSPSNREYTAGGQRFTATHTSNRLQAAFGIWRHTAVWEGFVFRTSSPCNPGHSGRACVCRPPLR